jgi:hypothetical protein
MSVLEQVERYWQWGLACYPFRPGTKEGRFEDLKFLTWGKYMNAPQSPREVHLLFANHPDSNIAILGGQPSGGAFFIDADGPQSFEDFSRLLTSYGVTTPVVQRDRFLANDPHTGGGCFWLKAPLAVKSCKNNGLGIEIRSQGQYIFAPHSIHPTGPVYQFLNETPEIFKLSTLDAIPELQLEPAPLTDSRRKIPRFALNLLGGDTEVLSHYRSRSEAEAAIIAAMYRAGFGFDKVLSCFYEYPAAGKFRELQRSDPKNAMRWLELTYREVCSWLDAHQNGSTSLAKTLETWAISKPWPGRTGSTDRAVYLSHLAIVQRCGKAEAYAASCRDLAELAGLSWQATAKANHRLVDDGLIELSDPTTPELANRWNLIDVSSIDTQSSPYVTECQLKKQFDQSHDAFRHSGLGKAGVEIYLAMRTMGKATPKQLEKATGRGRVTIWRKLRTMEQLMMVETTHSGSGVYQALDVNLDVVAKALETANKGRDQRELHIQQRRAHRLELLRERQSNAE